MKQAFSTAYQCEQDIQQKLYKGKLLYGEHAEYD